MNRTKNLNPVAASVALAAALIFAAPAAHAQKMNANGKKMSGSPSAAASTFRVSAGSVPGAVEPIMSRAATLLRVAEARQKTAPGEAKASYRAAADALRELLTSNRFAPGVGSGNSIASAPSVSSTQAGDDVRTLRAAAKSSTGNKMEMLNKAASLYATGTKEYFTAQLREALFDTNVTAAPVVIRRSGGTAAAGRRRPAGNQQGGVIVNPPSVYTQTGNNNGNNNNDPTVVTPLVPAGTTIITPGTVGGVIIPGTIPVNGPIVNPVVPGVGPGTPVSPATPVAPNPTLPANNPPAAPATNP